MGHDNIIEVLGGNLKIEESTDHDKHIDVNKENICKVLE